MDFNISDISRKTGLAKTNIKEILAGRVKYPKETAIRSIAEVVGITPEELLKEILKKKDLKLCY